MPRDTQSSIVDQEQQPPASTVETPNLMPLQRRRGKRMIAIAVVLMVLSAVTCLGFQYYGERKIANLQRVCELAHVASNWDELRERAAEWLNQAPDSQEARMFLADASIQLDDLDTAISVLGSVSDDFPGAIEALALRAEILFSDLNRPYDAEECWLRMLRINPGTGRAHQRLIYFYAMTLQRKKMLSQIDDAMRLGCEPPESYTYLLMANAINFSDGLTKTTLWRQSQNEDETLEVAQAFYGAKETAGAGVAMFGTQTVSLADAKLLQQCIQKYPTNLEVLSLQIEVAISEGDLNAVSKLLSSAPNQAQDDSRFWRYRGWLMNAQGKLTQAQSAFERALEIHRFDWPSRWLLASVCRKLGDLENAERHSQIALTGKALQKSLFERQTARDLPMEVATQIQTYLQQLGDSLALNAINSRLVGQ